MIAYVAPAGFCLIIMVIMVLALRRSPLLLRWNPFVEGSVRSKRVRLALLVIAALASLARVFFLLFGHE